jgi:hypothetical protein
MALTHEEITAIKKEVINECKKIFVQIDDCNEKQKEVNNKFANDHEQIALILAEQKAMRTETKSGLKFNNWLTTAILSVIIGIVVTMILKNIGVF